MSNIPSAFNPKSSAPLGLSPSNGLNVLRSASTVAVDAQNPWLGLVSYTEETSGYFHGRNEEARELVRRIEGKMLTVLFGQSGLGKSSLLQAGVFPRLRTAGFVPVYLRLDHGPDAPPLAEQIKRAVLADTTMIGQWSHPGSSAAGESLWEYFHHRDDVLRGGSGQQLTPVLVFDQFEELFIPGAANDATCVRALAFNADLADLVENRAPASFEARVDAGAVDTAAFDFARSDYRVLITLREDYLPHLESLKAAMPSLMQNRMRLTRLSGAQALEAVVKPSPGLVPDDVAHAIVAFVSGRSDPAQAEVEPSLLSLVCQELNYRRRAAGAAQIDAALLAGSRETILTEFYERTIADQPPAVRHWIENELLTDSGCRENVALERARKSLAAVGVDPSAIDTLVSRRLLRIEERLDVRRTELTHDVLCQVVKASRDIRLEHERKTAVEQQFTAVHRSLWRARLGVVLLAGLPLMLWMDLHGLSERDLRRQADDLNSVITGVRSYYSTNVVSRVLASPGATRVLHNYAEIPGAIPIPATLSLELGHAISENQGNIMYRFVSDYPFKNRAPHALDDFERNALQSLRRNPEQRLTEVSRSMLSGQVRLITPVIMGKSCVDCHNTHPESPKRDWKVGDVRGIQEVVVHQPIAANIWSFKYLLGYLSCVVAVGTGFVFRQQRLAASKPAVITPATESRK